MRYSVATRRITASTALCHICTIYRLNLFGTVIRVAEYADPTIDLGRKSRMHLRTLNLPVRRRRRPPFATGKIGRPTAGLLLCDEVCELWAEVPYLCMSTIRLLIGRNRRVDLFSLGRRTSTIRSWPDKISLEKFAYLNFIYLCRGFLTVPISPPSPVRGWGPEQLKMIRQQI